MYCIYFNQLHTTVQLIDYIKLFQHKNKNQPASLSGKEELAAYNARSPQRQLHRDLPYQLQMKSAVIST